MIWTQVFAYELHLGTFAVHLSVTFRDATGILAHWDYFGITFGLTLESLWVYFGVTSGWLWVTLAPLWANEGGIGSPWASLWLLWFHFGSVVGSPLAYEDGFGVRRGRFGVTLSSLRTYFWHMRMILGCLWCNFGCIKVNFQKLLIFPMNLNEFI